MKRKKYKEFVQFGQGLIYNIYPVKHKKKNYVSNVLNSKKFILGANSYLYVSSDN